jgi:hypothetical protein
VYDYWCPNALKKALLSTKGKGACKHPEHGDVYTK